MYICVFPRLGKFPDIISLNKLSAHFSLFYSGIDIMQMLICWLIYHDFLKLSSPFFAVFSFALLTGWIKLPCVSLLIVSSTSCSLPLNPSIEFFSSVIVLFNCVTYVWFFLIFPTSLLKFSLSSCIVLLILVSTFMTIILNSLLGKLCVSI